VVKPYTGTLHEASPPHRFVPPGNQILTPYHWSISLTLRSARWPGLDQGNLPPLCHIIKTG